MSKALLLLAVPLAAATALGGRSGAPQAENSAAPTVPAQPVVIAPDPAALKAYEACERVARARMLGASEARRCSESYLDLKLSFLPGVTRADYRRMDVAEAAAANLEGYLAFSDWRRRNARAASVLRD